VRRFRRFMRQLFTLIAVAGVIAVVTGSAGASQRIRHPRLHTTTGVITSLDRSRISVGGLTCALPTPSGILSGNFDLGERVTIDCVNNVLRFIRHHILAGTGTFAHNGSNGSNGSNVSVTSGANGTSSSTVVTEASTDGGNATATSIASASTSSGSSAQVRTSVSAEGPVTAITSTTISIGDATCPFNRASYPAGSAVAQLQIGDVAKINCETYPSGTTTATVSTP
jgi:hypothetical protein